MNVGPHTGKYTQDYRKWIGLDDADKTYNNSKVPFAKEFQLQKELYSTSKDAGFHDANQEKQTTTNDFKEMIEGVTNFANASTMDKDTFNIVTTTNA